MLYILKKSQLISERFSDTNNFFFMTLEVETHIITYRISIFIPISIQLRNTLEKHIF